LTGSDSFFIEGDTPVEKIETTNSMSVFTQPACCLAHRLQKIGPGARPLTNGGKPANANNVTSTYKNNSMSYCPSCGKTH
jgi:hypothetical protein